MEFIWRTLSAHVPSDFHKPDELLSFDQSVAAMESMGRRGSWVRQGLARCAILASLRNHKGNGIERTNEGAPARWRLKEVCRLATARPFCNRGLGELVGVAGARIV